MRERNVQAQDVDDDHEEGLHEQAGAEVRAEPVEDFEHGGDEHDERNVEREAGGRARAVHRVDLVAIRGYGGHGDARRRARLAWWEKGWRRDVQYRRNVFDDLIEDPHRAGRVRL